MKLIVSTLILMLAAPAAGAETITGPASVIDGDTLEIRDQRIRILDIDAPEGAQTCKALSGSEWRCGRWAANALAEWLGQYIVSCETTTKDASGLWLGRCDVSGVSVANWMAGHGWAVPDRDCKCEEVRAAASHAEQHNAGIWGGEFQMPWEWRKANQGQ